MLRVLCRLNTGVAKVRRLKKTAVPTQNLPWQFPNKRVSPTLVKARMERLKNRTQQKTTVTPPKMETVKTEDPNDTDESMENGEETKGDDSIEAGKIKTEDELDHKPNKDGESKEKVENEDDKDTVKMASRAPTRLRERKSVLKCELCGRKCLTPQALRTHQQTAHKSVKNDEIYPKKDIKVMNKPREPLKRATIPQVAVKQPDKLCSPKPPAKVNKSLNEGDLVAKVLQEFDSDGANSGTDYSTDGSSDKEILKPEKKNTRKTEFECPKCKRRFAVYFSAFRHIQKHHSGLPKGDRIPPNHPISIKPVRIEICTICNTMQSSDSHVCLGPTKLANGLVCSGCCQEFKTLTLFDMHKSGMHSEGVESMFFPSLDEFENWKLRMERQTKVQYSILDQNDTKHVHRCSAPCSDAERGRPRLCPSSVIVQEFTKGFQVHYYPNHYGHPYEPYSLGSAFKKYSIASLMNITASQLPDSEGEDSAEPDLYLQFNKVVNLLITEAARINISGLKKLMRKALEMMTIVNSYVEDEDDVISTKLSISPVPDKIHEEVKNALKNFKAGSKRKSDDVEIPAKKKKLLRSTENTLKVQGKIKSNTDNNREEVENLDSKATKGYVTPNKEKLKNNQQSPSFIDTYQQFVGKIVKPVEKKKPEKKKQIVKTKMGQFKPSPTKKLSMSPKVESPSRTSIGSVKEIKYEVKEQENDCNILILKI
ncbi:hypothetical protein MSG28_015901 [Choristoneura fumiferana]|uniref:Uncharacterized protein n=1 Tax=Choristoneura fumiferana TaxID=7141 RepID=A0ACC0K539_CHOFU|nr:hypothetical protein MSG28_015901 [Choristoneura fumiferana]